MRTNPSLLTQQYLHCPRPNNLPLTVDTAEYYMVNLCYFNRKWPETPLKMELQMLELEQHVALSLNPEATDSKATMWGNIHADYQPNPCPSFITCNPLLDNIPPPTI
jgi:hypothetical protein